LLRLKRTIYNAASIAHIVNAPRRSDLLHSAKAAAVLTEQFRGINQIGCSSETPEPKPNEHCRSLLLQQTLDLWFLSILWSSLIADGLSGADLAALLDSFTHH